MDRRKPIQYILTKGTAVLMAVAAFVMLPACNKATTLETDEVGVIVSLSADTKALDADEVGSIAILAYAVEDGSSHLVGYLYDDNVNGQDLFSMTLDEGGDIDFYVILNPASTYFNIVDADGNNVALNADTPTYTAAEIDEWKVKFNDTNRGDGFLTESTDSYKLIMTNLAGSGMSNRRYNIPTVANGWTTVPVDVTRTVSKVEVLFWSEHEYDDDSGTLYRYYNINSLYVIDPVDYEVLMEESESTAYLTGVHIPTDTNDNNPTQSATYSSTSNDTSKDSAVGYGMGSTQPDNDNIIGTSAFYTEDYFTSLGYVYVFANGEGGNLYGVIDDTDDTSDTDNCTTLVVRWATRTYNGSDYSSGDTTTWKYVYLPAVSRNTHTKVWCAFGSNVEHNFTYTVVDWEEVTIEVPAFE